ncbi:hypothetical protein [Legionella taurinensis]|uniref:Uncharacterized protein n=1 Tax=Legionella taurinensis TaxID=70611 RepID=A0A3A5L5K2_9GAMM|nr:hypothetical protein [Legionella taurinensis]RJT48078.1 hypothetical protein D6J04_05795 [Legionella taurinensis]RJT68292.1 hypothetical protein D6J03_05920 [Legionella taurinensis]STY25520.1 Uncharacterised protein [Legionella taurinensis]
MNLIQKKELLKQWNTKIANVPTRRIETRDQLLKLTTINDNDKDKVEKNYATFLHKRQELLSDNHQQGFTWEPHFQWALGFLTYFLPTDWLFFKGSKLRQALLETPSLDKFDILNETDLVMPPAGVKTEQINMEQPLPSNTDAMLQTTTSAMPQLDLSEGSPTEQATTRQFEEEEEEAVMHTVHPSQDVSLKKETKDEVFMTELEFEQALLHNPREALKDLNQQLDALSETIGEKELVSLFERMDLIKASVDPLVYYRLLEKLYQLQPLNTLRYFYSLYQNDPKEMPNSHEFIEQHLWAKTVVNLFAKNSITPVYAIQILLILLSAIPPRPNLMTSNNSTAHLLLDKGNRPIDFFGELFKVWSKEPGKSPINLPLTVYSDKKRHLQAQIEPLLDTNTKQNRELKSRFSITKGDGASYIQMLEDILDYIKPEQHPFLKHLARQAAELLLAIYYQNPDEQKELIWHEGHEGAETFRLIAKVLGKPAIIPAIHKTLLRGLDPFSPTIPIFPHGDYDFQHAERYAVEIILGAIISPEMALLNARHIRQMYVQIKNPSPFVISWIVKRVTPFCPDIVADLKYVLGEVAIYGTEDLPSHELTDFPSSPAELEKQIRGQLITLLDVSNTQRGKEENEASAVLFNHLIQLINHPNSRPDNFDKANQFITQFKNYLTDSLETALRKQIKLRKNELCRWEKSTLGAFEIGDEAWTMEKVMSYKSNASLAGYNDQFHQEYIDSQTAVNAFVVAMENIKPHDLHALREAHVVLTELQVYLTANQYKEWHQQLTKRIHDCSRDLKPAQKPQSTHSPQLFAPSAKIPRSPSDFVPDESKNRI